MLARAKMESICSLVTDGTHDSPKLQPSGVPFIKGKHISQGYIDFATCDFITEADHAEACRRVKPRVGDVLFSNIGSVGDTARVSVNREFSIKNVALFRPDPTRVDPRYFYYLVVNPRFRESILSLRSGSAQPFITLGSLRGYETSFHSDRNQQRRIASILSAYDDLIENNTRRIAILEEMARRIYEEWFVRFRFPGHEGVRMVESELGLVPEGWGIAAVEDVTETLGGGTPSKTEPDFWTDGAINWYSPTDLTGAKTVFMEESATKITELGLAKSSAKLFPPNSVMMTSRATLGVIAVNTTAACTNQGFIVCIPSVRMPTWLLFHWLKANASVFEGLATGATFKEITKGVFRKVKLTVPPSAIAAAFEALVGPMMDLVLRLERKNRNLRTTRDLLLPKLISGELDVSALPEPETVAA